MPGEQKKPITAERIFTNRENYFVAFDHSVDNIYNKDYSVLYFYGVGGIGKSRLKKELSKKLAAGADESVIISDSLNFQDAEHRSPNAAIYTLYTDLRKRGISFPAFEIAYAVHWQKLHPQLKLSQSNLPFLEEGSIISDFVSVLGDLPLVSLLPKVATVFHKINKKYSEWWTKNGDSELKMLENQEVFEIEQALPYYFALDLKDHYRDTGKKVVFFIDTYEALWSKQEERKSEKYFLKDKWLRTLIGNLPNTLWVIFGRERLRWDEITDDNWGDYIEQHLLGELSFADANRFLEGCDITDAEIREQIIQTSKGLPFYLDLQVDTYNKVIEKGRQPALSDFPKKYADILSRFCLYLEPSEIETLKILSFCRSWRYELFTALIKEFQTGYPLTSFNELLKFSFIDSGKDQGTYSIHQIMQEHLQEAVSEVQKTHIHTFLFNYYENQINLESTEKQSHFFEFNTKILAAVAEAIHHKKAYDAPTSYYDWLLTTSGRLYGETNSNLLQESLQKAFNDLDFDGNYIRLINIASEIARLYAWKSNLPGTEEYIMLGLQLCERRIEEAYPEKEDELIKNEPDLRKVHVDLLIQFAQYCDELDRNVEAFEVYHRAFSMAATIKYTPNKWSYASLLLDIGKTPEAEGFFYEKLREAIDKQDKELLAVTYTKIGAIFYQQQLYKESGVYFQKSMELYAEVKGTDHPYYWICNRKYADTLIAQGKTAEAEIIINEVLNLYIARYGESFADNGFIILSQAQCLLNRGDIRGGLDKIIESISMLRLKYSFSNATVLEGELLLCDVIQQSLKNGTDYLKTVFSEEEFQDMMLMYDMLISDLEFGYSHNFNGLTMNFGLGTRVISSFFKVIGDYYDLHNYSDKKDLLNNRVIELDRISKAQFQIRIFNTIPKTEIVGEEKERIIQRLGLYLGIDEQIPVNIYRSKLPFYDKTEVFTITFSNKINKYAFELDNKMYFLDWTNAPIYSLGESDFILSKESINDYLCFFFDSVKGKHGKFFIATSATDIPYRLDLDISLTAKKALEERVFPPYILQVTDDEIVLKACCFFKDSLFETEVTVKKDGTASMDNEELIISDLPIAVDPQIQAEDFSYTETLTKVIFFLERLLTSTLFEDEIAEDDQSYLTSLNENIIELKEGFDELEKFSLTGVNGLLNNAVYFIETYIKPKMDKYLFDNEIGLFLVMIARIQAYIKSATSEQ